MTDNNVTISKVQKLWATAADSAATPAEAATAMRLAGRLLAQARLDEQQVRAHLSRETSRQTGVSPDDMDTRTWGPRSGRHDGWLAMAVGAVVDCGVYQLGKAMTGYGLPADLAVGEALYQHVVTKLAAERRHYRKSNGVRGGSVEDRSFADGFALDLLRRARAQQTERRASRETMTAAPVPAAAADAGGAPPLALVVVTEGDALAAHERALVARAKRIGLSKGRSRSIRCDHGARAAGASASRSVSLSRGLVS